MPGGRDRVDCSLFVSLRHAGEAEIQKQRAEYEMIFHAVPVELRFKDANNRVIRVIALPLKRMGIRWQSSRASRVGTSSCGAGGKVLRR